MQRGPEHDALSLLRRRDPRGFDRAYAMYAPRLRSYLLRLSRRPDVADDLLQQTFLRLAERGAELRADSDLRAWLFTVARNAFLSQARLADTWSEDAAVENLSNPEPDITARLLLGDVESALSRLRMGDREILLLIGVEEMEPAQVAQLLGIDSVTLRQRLTRARARLLAELEGFSKNTAASKERAL